MAPEASRAARRDRAGSTRAARGVRAALLGLPLALVVAVAAACSPAADAGSDGTDDAAAAESLAAAAAPDDAAADAEAEPEPTPESLVTAEPDAYSEVGDLVAGFPIDLLPVPSDAVILVTSAVPVGDADVQEVSLNLRTSATADELLTLYRTALTSAGFSEVTAETADSDLAAQVTFVRSGGDEVVSIGVLDVDGARTVTIGGRVRTAD